MDSYKIIGLMSGTSLDGLDIALCDFHFDEKWTFKILEAETITYDESLRANLSGLSKGTALELVKGHTKFGRFCGKSVADFIRRKKVKVDFVASHGHTIFHQPSAGFSTQIGDGASMSVEAGLPVVCDFRSTDVALGGQGAPLVPLGDRLLFAEYSHCLNLGGIANISFDADEKRMAFDISACNILFNHLAQEKNLAYDKDGEIAASGKVHFGLLKELNSETYYDKSFPKSLGREDVDLILNKYFILNKHSLSIEDLMATAVEHVAQQIGRAAVSGKMLVTGGGAFNSVLVSGIIKHSGATLVIPDPLLLNYKEALIFAFLGLKRWRSEVNCLGTVTGASRDSIGGAIYFG